MFYFVYIPSFLSRTIRSVLILCVALRHPAKIEALRIYCVLHIVRAVVGSTHIDLK